MRSLTIIEHISLDGVIQLGGGSADSAGFACGDWSAPYRSPAGLQKLMAIYGETFDLLLGRRTYDAWSGFWPTAPKSPMADRLNAATKYVVTHAPASLAWGPAAAVGPELLDGVRALKQQQGPALILSGSSTLTSPLLEHGLADVLVLLVNPVLLGQGKRLFAAGTPPRSFVLERSEALPTGIVIQQYKADGALRNLR